MTYRQIEQAREIRLWIGQVFVPAATIAVTAISIPEVRETIATTARLTKAKMEAKIQELKTNSMK